MKIGLNSLSSFRNANASNYKINHDERHHSYVSKLLYIAVITCALMIYLARSDTASENETKKFKRFISKKFIKNIFISI